MKGKKYKIYMTLLKSIFRQKGELNMRFLIILCIFTFINCGSGMIGLLENNKSSNPIESKMELLEFTDISLIANIQAYENVVDPYDFYDTMLPYIPENKKAQILIYKKDNLYYLITTLKSNGTPNQLDYIVTIIVNNKTSDVLYEHSDSITTRTENSNSITYNLNYICNVDTFYNIIGPFNKSDYIYYLFGNVADFNQVIFYSGDGNSYDIKDVNVIIQL